MTKLGRMALAGTLGLGCLILSAGPAAAADDPCFFQGTIFSPGSTSCQNESQFKCDDGEWTPMGVTCRVERIAASRPCSYDGISYSTGSASCQGGTQFRCEDGVWRSLATGCTVLSSNSIRILPTGDTCMYESATVANGSTICKSNSTFLCNDGEWVNLGTLCR